MFDLRRRLDLRWPTFESFRSEGSPGRTGQVFDRCISRLMRLEDNLESEGLTSREAPYEGEGQRYGTVVSPSSARIDDRSLDEVERCRIAYEQMRRGERLRFR